MRVLITNLSFANYSGSETVVELLADGLRQAGHAPTVFAPLLGGQANAASFRGIPVTDRIGAVAEPPDVIHAQHLTPALIAMLRFPDKPAVFTCHSSHFSIEAPLAHPQIRKVIAVDESCARKCRSAGIDDSDLTIIPNAVDLKRFARRPPLPARPARALLLTKTAGQREAVAAACGNAGVSLDELGPASGRVVNDLEARLREYDIVFATARMALEAAVVGCAVVVCDDRGFAGMLTRRNLEAWRRLNFGVGLLGLPVSTENLMTAIQSFDPADAALVCDHLRETAGAEAFVERHLEEYRRAISLPAPDPAEVARANGYWAEELAVTPANRLWKTINFELNLAPPAEPNGEILDRLERIEELAREVPAREVLASLHRIEELTSKEPAREILASLHRIEALAREGLAKPPAGLAARLLSKLSRLKSTPEAR